MPRERVFFLWAGCCAATRTSLLRVSPPPPRGPNPRSSRSESGVWWSVFNTADVGGPDGIITWADAVVWGNARLTPPNKVTCQHGAAECKANILQNCIVAKAAGNASAWLPALHCLSGHGPNQSQFAKQCTEAAGLAFDAVNTCWNGPEGLALQLAAGANTTALNPPLDFVPYVTLGSTPGTFCNADSPWCDGLLAAVCKAYIPSAAKPKPASCP